MAFIIRLRITLLAQSKLTWAIPRKLNRYFDDLRLLRRTVNLKGRQVVELILLRNGTKIDKVTFIRRTLDGTDAEPQLVVSRRQRLHNVFGFSPA